jgi:hypothetical protein
MRTKARIDSTRPACGECRASPADERQSDKTAVRNEPELLGLSRTASRDQGLLFPLLSAASGFGNTAIGQLVRSRLEVSRPEDAMEVEAEKAAEAIDGPSEQLSPASGGSSEGRYRLPTRTEERFTGTSSGQALDADVRRTMETRLNEDFSAVRVHTESQAPAAVDALAFTVGTHIAFGPGQYRPMSNRGRHLLAHELAHVSQRKSGSSGTLLLQRQVSPAETSSAKSTSVEFGWFTADTHAALAALMRLAAGETETDTRGLSSGDPLYERALLSIDEMRSTAEWLNTKGMQPLTAEMASRGRVLLAERDEIYVQLAELRAARVRNQLRLAKREADVAAERAEMLKPRMDDGLRAAYRSGDEAVIREAAHGIGYVLDLGVAIHELARQIMEEYVAPAIDIELEEATRFAEGLVKLNKGLVLINLALALTEEKRATDLEEGARWIGLASEAFATAAAVASAPFHVLYAQLSVIPMLKLIIHQIGNLTEAMHGENVQWVAFEGQLRYCEAEPGGCQMFDFMVAVMDGDSEAGVPVVPSEVKRYLVDHREQLEAGADEEVPTSGWWFWRSLDSSRARHWIFEHRKTVWGMFYGSMAVPTPRK